MASDGSGEVAGIIGSMLAGWPSFGLRDKGMQARLVAAIVTAVDRIPTVQVTEAARRFAAGRVGNPDYPPTSAQFAQEARRLLGEAAHAVWRSNRSAERAETVSPEERARVGALFRAFAEEFRESCRVLELTDRRR